MAPLRGAAVTGWASLHPEHLVAAMTLMVLVVGPVALAAGSLKIRRSTARPAAAWDWKLSVASALLYALAFNLTFFIQELFLVLPKALTPGLRPTLFHNNHTWTGDNPLASLLQGTGALAIFVMGSCCALLLQRRAGASTAARLFLIWMAYNGLLQSLPQVVIGSVEPENDVGMAMNYLHLSVVVKTAVAFVALIAIAATALFLRGPFLSLARASDDVAAGPARTRFMFRVATLPAFAAILLIIPFRVPRNWVEVAAVPVVVTVVGLAWIQAGAWAAVATKTAATLSSRSIVYATGALLVLLLVFQLLLRPGVKF